MPPTTPTESEPPTPPPSKFAKTLSLFLPGIFLLGFNIGTGSVTSMAAAGANYGMSLLWTIAISCVATFFMISVYSRYTLATGETALQAFRKHIHPAVGIFFIVALTAGVSGSVMGVMGIVADVCFEWSKTIVAGGIAPIYFAAFFVALVYFIFWYGETKVFERSLAVMVAIMAGCFLLNFFIMMPPPGDILNGLIPRIPEVAEGKGSPYLVIASMVGTTVFSGLFIIRTTLVKEAGWTIDDLGKQRNDAIVSTVMMFVISGSIMAAAAATLHVEGVTLTDASQMIGLLEPLVGSLATALFALGIVAAGVSSQFPNVLMLPWLLCDYNNSQREMTLPRYRIMVFLISLLVLVIIASQAFQALILPATVGCILYLGNRVDLMGQYKNSKLTNIVLVAILLFSIVTSLMGIVGVWETISKEFLVKGNIGELQT